VQGDFSRAEILKKRIKDREKIGGGEIEAEEWDTVQNGSRRGSAGIISMQGRVGFFSAKVKSADGR